MENNIPHWSQVLSDLAPFCDPGTDIDVLNQDAKRLSIKWSQRGQDRETEFLNQGLGGISVSHLNVQYPYVSFLAGTEVSDLRALAQTIVRTMRKGNDRDKAFYVETKARYSEEKPPESAVRILQDQADLAKRSPATTVVMVTGEAGAGKTSVLKQLVLTQAEKYIQGKSEAIFLYVNAQGRALARFHEALATELQDLRANFTYHGVSTLVRRGLIIPVIDGFDELLGVGGYDDAFSSLSQFIEELNGEGAIIASARSTYYEQEFVQRANASSRLGAQVWKQVSVEVLAWTDEEVADYVRSFLGIHSDEERIRHLKSATDDAFSGRNASLKQKPFFVARTVRLLQDGNKFRKNDDLLGSVVDAYVERERVEKLRNKSGDSILSSEQIKALLADLAEEMWNQETRELDRKSAEELAQLALLDFDLDESTSRIVLKRISAFAFLMPGEKNGSVTFEHETFFDYFLCARFFEQLSNHKRINAILFGRSPLSRDLAQLISTRATSLVANNGVQHLISKLEEACSTSSARSVQIRENCGRLVSEILTLEAGSREARKRSSATKLDGFIFPGSVLDGVTLEGATLTNIEFRRTDLSSTRFLNCRASGCTFIEILIDPSATRLEIGDSVTLDDFSGLRVRSGEHLDYDFDPAAITENLEKIGCLQNHQQSPYDFYAVDAKIIKLVEKFSRAYNRCNPVCESDDFLQSIFLHAEWQTIRKSLIKNGVVSEEQRNTGGQPKTFLRRQVLPAEILGGLRISPAAQPEVANFWKEIQGKFPSKR